MNRSVILRGYRYSVYNRIARLALHEKGISYRTEEIDPFSPDLPQTYLQRHPFGRVPVLSHGAFDVYETTAITRYIDAAFDGPPLVPQDPNALTRLAQVVSIVDSYGYVPLVRQVFAHRVFRPSVGEQADEAVIETGLAAARPVLRALDTLAAERRILTHQHFTLADCHLAPMIAYFVQATEGAAALRNHPALSDWWARVSQRDSLIETDPGLPEPL